MIKTSELIINAAKKAMDDGETHYPPAQGIPQVLEAAAEWMNQTYKTSYGAQNTIATCGAKFAEFLLFKATLNEGDEVLVISPYWTPYLETVGLFGAKTKIIEAQEKNGWKIVGPDIRDAIGPKAKMIILNNAANPTGALYDEKEIYDILTIAKEKGLIVLSDEVYSGLVYDGEEFVSCGKFKEFSENVFVAQSCSKNFAMTGWRIGFLFGQKLMIKKLTALQSQVTTGTSIISQWAAVAALKNSSVIQNEIKATMQKRRDSFYKEFNDLFSTNITPTKSSLYAFISVNDLPTTNKNTESLCQDILDNCGVATVPGEAFGKPEYIRFSFGEKEDKIKNALGVLCKYLK